MKILYHHRIASKDGQYVHVEEMINAFRNLGHVVKIVSPHVADEGSFGSEGGFVKILKQYIPKPIYELIEFCYSFYVYAKLYRVVKTFKPDFIYERYNLFMPAGIWIKKHFNIPLLLEVNAPLFHERSKFDGLSLKRVAEWSENYVWGNADLVFPVTKVLAKIVEESHVDSSIIHVLHNGVDLDKFSNVPNTELAKKHLGFEGKFILGFTGFVREWHGLDKVVDVISKTKNDTHLLIVGEGPAKASIMERANELGVTDRVTFTGIIDRGEVADYVASFDIALQPAVVDYASPLKIFEYLALGKAIVAPDKPNVREIIQHEYNALLFSPNEVNSFAHSILRLCEEHNLRKNIGLCAKNTILTNAFTWKENAKSISKAVSELMAGKDRN